MTSRAAKALLCILAFGATKSAFAGTATQPQVPVFFEPNRGQFNAAVQFVGRTPSVPVGLFADGVGFEASSHNGARPSQVRMRFLSMDRKANWTGMLPSPGVTNYLTSAASVRGVERFQKTGANGIYPGIDVEVHGSGSQVEYDFIVHPGADPSRIQYKVDGSSVKLTNAGELVMQANGFELHTRAPQLYQERDGVRKPVQGHFVLRGHTVSFEVGSYDKRQALVIDPIVFAKTITSSGYSWANAATTDSSGNVYVVGFADAAFVSTAAAQVSFGGGSTDAIVMKFSAAGNPVWSTFLGGSGADYGRAIMVDSTGAVIVLGDTDSTNFPTTSAAYQKTNKGKRDGFIVKLNAAASAVVYSSYFGGTDDDWVTSGLLDPSGNVLVGGYTYSTNYPTAGSPVLQSSLGGAEDFFLTKFAASLATLTFSTYMGGPGQDELNQIALDTAGNIYLAGWSTSSTFTATAGAAQTSRAGQSDNIIARLNPAGSAIQMLTYLGGSLSDAPLGLAVEPDGSAIWVSGFTNSSNFPTSAGALQKVFAGGFDGTLFKLDSKGALLAGTYIGGPGDDAGNAVIVRNGIPTYVGVLTTTQYDKSDAQGLAPRAASSRAQMSFEIMSADLATVTSTTTYVPDDPNIDYVGEASCQASAADASTIVCGAAAFPIDQTANPRGQVVAVNTGSSGGGPTPPIGFVPRTSHYQLSIPAASDPVDGGTGAFYDIITDLNLGGPLPLQFKRYYSSMLSTGGLLNPLGTNWMSNYDMRVEVNTTTASALLFEGKLITFTKNGSAWQLSSPLIVPYQFTQSASGYKLMDPTSSLVYTFNLNGALTRFEDRNGNAITVTPGTDGPASAVDATGRKLTFTYSSGRLTKVQDQTQTRTVTFSYSGNVQTSSTDVLGQATNYAYTTAGSLTSLMTARQYPLGARTTQTYDSTGRVTSQVLPTNNKTTTIAYDTQHGAKITDSSGAATSEGFDSTGAVTGFTDPLGSAFSVTYDSSGRRTGWTDKNGGKEIITYDSASGNVASEKTAAGVLTTYTYSAQSQNGFIFYVRTVVGYGNGTSASYTYDANGNRTSYTDGAGAVTKYAYGASGNLSTMTSPNNATVTYAYNTDLTVASTTDALGNVTGYAYDNLKRVAKVTEANGSATSYTYDLAGNRLAVQEPVGSTNSTTYDADQRRATYTYAGGGTYNFAYTKTGQVSSVTSPTGAKRSYTYDDFDQLATATDPAGVVSSYSYDASHQLVKTSLGSGTSLSQVFRYGYDAEGHVTTVTDGSNRSWTYGYDGDGRPKSMTPPGGGTFALKYDGAGRLIGQVNAAGDTVNFTLDGADRILSTSVAANTITSSVKRDEFGNVTELTDPNGNKWPATYDALGRVTSTSDPLGQTWALGYTKNRLTGATFPLGSVTIGTDANGRITSRAFSDGTILHKSFDARGLIATADNFSVTRDAAGLPTATNGIAVGLDAAGRAKSFTYASGKSVTYTYDAQGRVVGITDWVGGTTTIGYDGAGRIVGITYPNGVGTTQAWDSNGRLSRIVSGSIASINLTTNTSGQITSAERNLPSTPTLAVGSTTNTFDAANQMVGATYDKMGRATAQNGRSYSWNLASQLTGFTVGSQTTTLTYDGLAHLNTSTTGGVTRTYVYNHLAKLPALSIVKQGGSDLRYYVYLPDGRMLYSVEASGGARHFYHFDEMGNTTFLTDDAGAVTDTYAITPFGDVADRTGTTDNPFTWQGQYGILQEAPGLFFVRSRHYDATTGRFLSRDLLTSSDPRSGTPYVYAVNNPLLNIDPFGNATSDQISFFQGILSDPTTTADTRKSIYQLLAAKLTVSFQAGNIDGFSYIIWIDILNGGYDNADLDLTQVFQLAWPPPPPDPPKPVVTPKPVVAPKPAPKAAPAPKTTQSLLAAGLIVPPALAVKGGLVGLDGNPIISDNSEGLLSEGGLGIISQDGNNIISQDGNSLITNDGGS